MGTSLRLSFTEDGADPERLDSLTRQLGDDLRELDVEDVAPLPGPPAPEGSRGIEAAAVGGLLLSLATPQTLGAVVGAIKAWLSRGHGAQREVRLEIDGDVLSLSGASTAEQQRLVDLFVNRHSPGEGQSWTAGAER
jgi:hypothetical protein